MAGTLNQERYQINRRMRWLDEILIHSQELAPSIYRDPVDCRGYSMRIYFVRHGETETNRIGRFQGRSDLPLNPNGLKQAEAVGNRLQSTNIAAIYPSPQVRAMETATPMATAKGMQITPVDDLRELDIGDLEGLTGQDLQKQYPSFLASWASGEVSTLTMPGGESVAGLQERAWLAISAIRNEHADDAVVVVSHNFVIQTILMTAMMIKLDNFRKIRQDLAAISEVIFRGEECTVVSLNDRCHLWRMVSID